MAKMKKVFKVRGLVRGTIGTHRALPAAVRTMIRDRKACCDGGSSSDARVYVSIDGGPEYQVPVCVDFDNTWVLCTWSERVPQSVIEAVE